MSFRRALPNDTGQGTRAAAFAGSLLRVLWQSHTPKTEPRALGQDPAGRSWIYGAGVVKNVLCHLPWKSTTLNPCASTQHKIPMTRRGSKCFVEGATFPTINPLSPRIGPNGPGCLLSCLIYRPIHYFLAKSGTYKKSVLPNENIEEIVRGLYALAGKL